MFKSIVLLTCLISPFAMGSNIKEELCINFAEGFESYYILRDKGYTHDFINGYVKSGTAQDKTVEQYGVLYQMIKHKPINYTRKELKSATNAYCLMSDIYNEESY